MAKTRINTVSEQEQEEKKTARERRNFDLFYSSQEEFDRSEATYLGRFKSMGDMTLAISLLRKTAEFEEQNFFVQPVKAKNDSGTSEFTFVES